jgi:4-hydroxybenzoate polyprenyltransferase
VAALLGMVSLSAAFLVNPWVAVVLLVYLAQNVAYSFWLKNIVIVDVMVLSLGFLLRVVAGVIVVQVANFSPWLYICVTLLALFLGFGKRRQEIVLLEDDAGAHRASLAEYNLPMLDQIMAMITTSTLIAYTFYSFDAIDVAGAQQDALHRALCLLFSGPLSLPGACAPSRRRAGRTAAGRQAAARQQRALGGDGGDSDLRLALAARQYRLQ